MHVEGEGEVEEVGRMEDTIQWRQYANFGSEGVGASGSMSISVYVSDSDSGEDEEVGEMEILGVPATWLTRTKPPFAGEMEG